MQNGVIFSDGSYDNGVASFAFLAQPDIPHDSISQFDYDSTAHGSGSAEGTEWDINSYRAELRGILAAIQFTNDACQSANITEGACTLYCDSKGALYAAFGHKRPTPRWSSFDLVTNIRNAIANSPVTWKYQHIKGHQDSHRPFHQLDYYAKGNVLVDQLASSRLRQNHHRNSTTQQAWIPSMHNQQISGNIHIQIRYNIHRPLMQKRWASTMGIQENDHNQCLWDDFFYSSLRTQPSRVYQSVIKYNSRLLPVGKKLLRRKHSQSETCPGCSQFEDHDHIITCTHSDMQATFDMEMESIETFLSQTTSLEIMMAVKELLHIFRSDKQVNPDDMTSDLVHHQYTMGSRAFFAGLWHKGWISKQKKYHQKHRIQKSVDRWLTQILHKIQLVPITMWHTRNKILHKDQNDTHRDISG
jgi:hypothetical protein